MENIMTCSKWHTFFYFWILHLSSFPLSPNPPYHMFEHKNTDTHRHTHTTHTHTINFSDCPYVGSFRAGVLFLRISHVQISGKVEWSEVMWIELKWGLIDFSFSKLDEVLVGLWCDTVWHSVVWCGVLSVFLMARLPMKIKSKRREDRKIQKFWISKSRRILRNHLKVSSIRIDEGK